MEYTKIELEKLGLDLKSEPELVENISGKENLFLRGLLDKMRI